MPRRLPRGPTRDPGDGLGATGPETSTDPARAPLAGGPAPTTAPLPPPTTSSLGATFAAEPNPWPARLIMVALLAAAGYGGYRLYRRLTRPDVVAISSPYRSSTGVTVELPGGSGWHSDRRLRLKESRGPAWMRGDVMFRGPTADAADEFVLVLRIHAPGGYSRAIDPEQLRSGLERGLQQTAAAAGATTRSLACVLESTWRTEQAVACYGVVVLPMRTVPCAVYLWVASDDDVVGIGYATGDGTLDPLEAMARTAR